jgi:hypothetical protein
VCNQKYLHGRADNLKKDAQENERRMKRKKE